MAISAGTVWEVRATGDDSQGGLFTAGQAGAGTDYSQQDAAQLSLTDVVTNGTTTVTSVTGGFTAAMIANGINIAGTCYMIATRSSTNTITVDRTIGAAVGQTGKVGGALATPGYASGQAVAANNVWVKAGTYTGTGSTPNVSGGPVLSPSGSAGFPFRWEGYQAARGDEGTRPVVSVSAAVAIFATTAAYTIFDNIETSSSSAGAIGFEIDHVNCRTVRCKAGGSGLGFYTSVVTEFELCEGTVTGVCFRLDAASLCHACHAHGGGTDGFKMFAGGSVLAGCISQGNAGAGVNANGFQVSLLNCDLYNNTGDGASGLQAAGTALNCIASTNGGYGFTSSAANATFLLGTCATYSNTSGATNNLTNTTGMIILSADPYTAAGTNFGLNNTAGGGAACRAAGLPAAFPGLASTIGYPDIGAVQHQAVAGTRAYGSAG